MSVLWELNHETSNRYNKQNKSFNIPATFQMS